MAIIERERSAGGDVSCVVQFGGQTPLKLALALQEAGVDDPRHVARLDRPRRGPPALLAAAVGPRHPAAGERHRGVARGGARGGRARSAIPVVVRPSYVLGGRGMAIVFDAGALDRYMTGAVDVSHDRPVLIDRFLEDAFEFDVDAVADATGAVVIGGIMEHIEEAGIHSGDSSCVVPPFMVAERHLAHDSRLHAPHRPRAEGRRPDEHPVRHQGRHGLRARGEPALVAHGAVHLEGDRRAAGEDRGARGGRPDAGRARPGRRPGGRRRVREEPGVPVRALPGRRHDPRPRDEVDRRGDGRRRQLRRGVRQGDDGRRAAAAARRAACSSASTTATSRPCCRSRATSRSSGSRWPRRAAPRRSCARTASTSR